MRAYPTVESLRFMLRETKNVELLSTWDGNARSIITCRCYCGTVFTKSLRYIMESSNPCGCDKRNEKIQSTVRLIKETKNLEILSSPNEWRGCDSCIVEVKCFCGNVFKSLVRNIKHHTNSCGCLVYQYDSGNMSYQWKGVGELSSHKFQSIKVGATKRKIEFDISISDAWHQFIFQDRKCALSGIELKFNKTHLNRSDTTASLDRIDSTRGYTKENIQWIHKTINKMKMGLDINRFLYLCRLVVNPIHNTVPNLSIYEKSHSHNYKGLGNINNTIFKSICRGAYERNLTFDITIRDMWDKYVSQNGYCSLTGLPIEFKYKANTASLDRIDSRIGYTLNNIQWVHCDINTKLKQTLTETELNHWCHLICDYDSKEYMYEN